jgi:hypothetical protein
MLEPIQGGVERALVDLQPVSGDLLDAQQNAVAVKRAQRDGFEDEEIERPLQQFRRARHRGPLS